MELVQWSTRPEGLRQPVLVCAFRGWNDAGEAATTALSVLVSGVGAQVAGTVDGEEIFDYQTTRPTIAISDGTLQSIEWPDVEIYAGRTPRAPRDLLLAAGAEPSYRWRTFATALLDVAHELGSAMIVTLGALLADVPHTRPIRMGGLSAPRELVEGRGLRAPSYQGPTGIVGVIHAMAIERGFPAASIWASVPHYLGTLRSAPAALGLVRTFEGITGVAVDASALEDASSDYERQVGAAVDRDAALQELVTRLERESDREEAEDSARDIPTGDALARELEKWLQQRDDDPAD